MTLPLSGRQQGFSALQQNAKKNQKIYSKNTEASQELWKIRGMFWGHEVINCETFFYIKVSDHTQSAEIAAFSFNNISVPSQT